MLPQAGSVSPVHKREKLQNGGADSDDVVNVLIVFQFMGRMNGVLFESYYSFNTCDLK